MAIAPTRTDAALVRRLQARDRTAWEELYAEYQPRLRAFGYRLAGNAHDADDLVQETFVKALPALDRLDPDGVDLTAYLFATTRNLFLKQVERAKRAEPTAEVPEPDLPQPIEDDPERGTLLRAQQEEVRLANARLEPRQRLVLALCELEDRSYAEIGELVGLNENAVAQLVFRARERLRTELRLVQVDPERLPEECRAFLPLLAQHLDGKLKGAKLDRTLAHLESCERCQASLADMEEAKRRYRALLLPPLGVPAEEARAAIEDELDRAGYWRGGAGRRAVLRRPHGKAAVLAAVVVAALCVGGGLGAATLLVDRGRAGGGTGGVDRRADCGHRHGDRARRRRHPRGRRRRRRPGRRRRRRPRRRRPRHRSLRGRPSPSRASPRRRPRPSRRRRPSPRPSRSRRPIRLRRGRLRRRRRGTARRRPSRSPAARPHRPPSRPRPSRSRRARRAPRSRAASTTAPGRRARAPAPRARSRSVRTCSPSAPRTARGTRAAPRRAPGRSCRRPTRRRRP